VQHFAEKIVTALADSGCECVIVGGISAVLHGAPIVTQDLDVCYRRHPDNLTRIAAALAPLQLRLRGLPEGVPNQFDRRSLEFGTNFTLVLQEGEEFDLLAEMSAIGGYDAIVGRAIAMDVAGHTVKVLSLDDLIRTKRAAGRPKDLPYCLSWKPRCKCCGRMTARNLEKYCRFYFASNADSLQHFQGRRVWPRESFLAISSQVGFLGAA
jgi:hypothetical protein